jgi:malate dehydrogenase (oxaloacetate-decarboxylating)
MELDITLKDLGKAFPADLTPEQRATAQTLFFKKLAVEAHTFFGGKIQAVPKCGLWGFNWFNVWYTPGVSKISTTIRDDNDASFALTNRGNLVAVVSDSTRVLGDGDCTPSGGLGVMEGKAFLMKYLGGVDAVPLCIDSRGRDGKHDPDKIIEFVKMLQPSFGAVNLEDISQPNCFKVLDELREACDIPVWHDDAQGTACSSPGRRSARPGSSFSARAPRTPRSRGSSWRTGAIPRRSCSSIPRDPCTRADPTSRRTPGTTGSGSFAEAPIPGDTRAKPTR